MKYIQSSLVLFFVALSFSGFTQTKPAVKFKPPALTSIIGGYKDSATISVAEAERIVGEKIYVSDSKKNMYAISSYQFAYRKIGVTEDEETGKVTPTKTLVASLFKTTPLSETWIMQVKEQVKPGDELWFFDVIVKDAQGRVMYAPDIKFMVKN
jgi:hypothetical protein